MMRKLHSIAANAASRVPIDTLLYGIQGPSHAFPEAAATLKVVRITRHMPGDLFTLTGTFVGAVGLSWAVFTAVSYLEVKRKIDEAVDAGDTPYELNTEQKAVRRPKPVKKALSKKERSKRK